MECTPFIKPVSPAARRSPGLVGFRALLLTIPLRGTTPPSPPPPPHVFLPSGCPSPIEPPPHHVFSVSIPPPPLPPPHPPARPCTCPHPCMLMSHPPLLPPTPPPSRGRMANFPHPGPLTFSRYCRRLYLNKGMGSSSLARAYGRKKRNGTAPAHKSVASTGHIRHMVRQLQKLGGPCDGCGRWRRRTLWAGGERVCHGPAGGAPSLVKVRTAMAEVRGRGWGGGGHDTRAPRGGWVGGRGVDGSRRARPGGAGGRGGKGGGIDTRTWWGFKWGTGAPEGSVGGGGRGVVPGVGKLRRHRAEAGRDRGLPRGRANRLDEWRALHSSGSPAPLRGIHGFPGWGVPAAHGPPLHSVKRWKTVDYLIIKVERVLGVLGLVPRLVGSDHHTWIPLSEILGNGPGGTRGSMGR